MSKRALSGYIPSISPFAPSATCSTSAGTGSEVKTISVCWATSFGELAHTAPFARNGSAAARLRSCTTRSCPAFCKLAAMPLPIMPSPMNPTRMLPSADHKVAAGTSVACPAAERNDNHRGAGMTDNPFFEVWTTPFGLPPFDRIRPEHFPPAFDRGIAEQRGEIAVITSTTVPPSFANTIEALERSGRLLDRVSRVFFNLDASNSNEALEEIARDYAPKLTQHRVRIALDEKLIRG